MEKNKQLKVSLKTVTAIVILVIVAILAIVLVSINSTKESTETQQVGNSENKEELNISDRNVLNAETVLDSVESGQLLKIENIDWNNLRWYNEIDKENTKYSGEEFEKIVSEELEIIYNDDEIKLKINKNESLKKFVESTSFNGKIEIGEYDLKGLKASEVKKIVIAAINTEQEAHIDVVALTNNGDVYTIVAFGNTAYISENVFSILPTTSKGIDIEQGYTALEQTYENEKIIDKSLDVLIMDEAGKYYSYERIRREYFNKISETKIDVGESNLREFLSRVATLNMPTDNPDTKFTTQGIKLTLASYYSIIRVEEDKLFFAKEDIEDAMMELFNEHSDPLAKGENDLHYNGGEDRFTCVPGEASMDTYLVKIENQSYADGVYTITLVYTYLRDSEIIDAESDEEVQEIINNKDCYRTDIQVKKNDNFAHSKYQLVNTSTITSNPAGKVEEFN